MITAGRGIQSHLRPVLDLGPLGEDLRVVARPGGIPGHQGDVARRAARVDPRAGPVGDLPQDRGDPLVGEAEPDPDQMPVHQPGQHLRQLAGVRPPVLGGGQHHAVRPVVLAVREQDRQFRLAEHIPRPPPVKAQLVLPGHEPCRRGGRADPHPGVHDPRIVVRGHHGLERAPADQFLHGCPGPARLRVGPHPQHPAQHLTEHPRAEATADDLHDRLGTVVR
jgi:hypothetical protein